MSVKFAMENKKGQPGAKYPPPPPPGGRGGRGSFGGPMRNRGQQQNRFNPMQQQRGRGAGGGFRGGRGNWRGGANNSNNGFGNDGYGGGFGDAQGYGDQSFGDQSFGADYGQAYDESSFGQGYDQGYDQGFDQSFEGGFGGGDEAYYDDGQQGQSFQNYPENGYQGYYDAIGFQGYQMPGQNKGSFSRGGGRGGGARGGGRGGPRGGRGAPRGGPRGGGRGGGPGPKPTVAPGGGIALYVYNIGPSATDDDVMTIFSHYGSVTKVDVIMDYEKNVTKNYCFVHMATQEEAETAISALNERYCMRPNHPMQVRYHQPKGKGGK